MNIKELILQLEQSTYRKGRYENLINNYINKLKQQNPNNLVMWNDGECDNDGIFIPYDNDGNEMGPPQPFKEGQSFPDDGYRYVRVGRDFTQKL